MKALLTKWWSWLTAREAAFERFVVVGPDPIDPAEPPGALEALLSWPVRLLVLAATIVLTRVWHETPPGQKLGWGVAYVGSIAISIAVSFAGVIVIANVILGGAWVLTARREVPSPDERPITWAALTTIEFLNRQISHIEALWIWIAFFLSVKPDIAYELPLTAAVILIGPPLINWITQVRHRRRERAAHKLEDDADIAPLTKANGRLQWARRDVIYIVTLVGIGFLLLRTHDGQAANLVPLAVGVGLGAGARLFRHRLRAKFLAGNGGPHRNAFLLTQTRLSHKTDVGLGPVLVLASFGALIAFSFVARSSLEKNSRDAQDGPSAAEDVCVPEPGGPAGRPDVEIFLVSDSQFHELGGDRFPGQMELAEAIVPVALRPVELDVLSAAPLWNLGRLYRSHAERGPGTPAAKYVFWAHLGDFGDHSCAGEVIRATKVLEEAFGKEQLIGLAPGNHDMSFTGNFFWSPFWKGACPSGRLEKEGSIAEMLTFGKKAVVDHRGQMHEVGRSLWPSWVGGHAGALVTVTPLGEVTDRSGRRGLAAIFIDSSDGQGFDYGISGVFGTFSRAQDKELRKLVDGFANDPLYQDPAWIVFIHHPVAELTKSSRDRLEDFLKWLDTRRAKDPADPEPRTLAVVSAHTHAAGTHNHCIGRRLVREIVIGSTIDPPQQGATLEVGADSDNLLSLRLRTIPAVGRPGMTCGPLPSPLVSAQQCRNIVADLKKLPECAPLFELEGGVGRDCGELERPLDFSEQIQGLAARRGPTDPKEIKRAQGVRARELWSCICRKKPGGDQLCASPREPDQSEKEPPEDPIFKGEAYQDRVLDRLREKGDRGSDELGCLAWAAAAVQRHKAGGMTFADALRCAYDDKSLAAAQETVASLEARACL
jgi:hypothetical protein